MAGNQREIARSEKRLKKDKRNKKIVWIIIAVIIVILVIMKVCEININSVKDHFTDENGNFTLTEGVVEDNYPYTIDASRDVFMSNINNRIGVLTPNSFTVIDSSDAQTEYVFEHGYSNPLMKSSGVYSLVYDQGGNTYRLDTTSDAVYEREVSNSILCADVSKNGTAAIATTSNETVCDVYAYNKSLKELLKVSISYGYAVDIAVSDNGKKVSVVCINSENANLKTIVYSYEIGYTEPAAVELPQGLITDIRYSGNNLLVVGDSYAGVIRKNNTYEPIFEQGTIKTTSLCYTPSGELILVYNKFSNSTENVISYIKPNGKIKNEITVSGNIKSVSASSNLVSILTNNQIISYSLSKGEEKNKMQTDDSSKSICQMGNQVFVHRQSLIDRGADQTE